MTSKKSTGSVKLTISYDDKPSVTVVAHDRVAEAIQKLVPAGQFGVRRREIAPDVFARLMQLHIPFEWFADERLGTGANRCWLRLDTSGGASFAIEVDTATRGETPEARCERRVLKALQPIEEGLSVKALGRKLRNVARIKDVRKALNGLLQTGKVQSVPGKTEPLYAVAAA